MSILRLILFCILLQFIWLKGFGQSLKGSVRNIETGEAVENVHVKILDSTIGTVTDKDGQFGLPKSSHGRTIRFSAIGFETVEMLLNDSLNIVSLHPSVILLNNAITVTAKRSERNQFDVGESVSILGQDELNLLSARSVPEALANATGVWMQKTNHGGGSPVIRGLVGNHVLLLVDGIRMNNTAYRYGPNQYLATVDPGLVEQIEAIRGKGSVLYGSDALGGVVSITSKTPGFSNEGLSVHGAARARWMSAGMERSGRGEIQLAGKRVAFQGGFSARDFGDIVAGKKFGTLHPSGYNELAGDGKLLVRVADNNLLTVAHQQIKQSDVPRYDQVAQGGYSFYEFDPQERQLSFIRWETAIENKWISSLRATLALNRTGEVVLSRKNNSDEVKTISDGVRTISFSTEIKTLFRSNWTALSGLEFYGDEVRSTGSVFNEIKHETLPQRGSYADGSTANNFSIFTDHEIQLTKFTFSGGLRFNEVHVAVKDLTFGNERITPNALVGNAGIAYEIRTGLRLLLSGNTAFRVPNVDDMSKFGAVESGIFEIPSAKLSPEKSTALEIGMKSVSKTFSASVAAYYNRLTNLIDRVPSQFQNKDSIDDRRVYQKQNVGDAELFGFEADTEWKIARFLVAQGSVTYTYGENISKHEPMRRIPPLFGRLGVRFQKSRMALRAEYLWAGKQDRLAAGDLTDARIAVRLNNSIMPGWNVFNIYSSYEFRKVAFTASVQNIFNNSYRVYSSGVDAYGRVVTLSLGIDF